MYYVKIAQLSVGLRVCSSAASDVYKEQVLQNPRILIMDVATSALDVDTERKVCLNLMEALRGRTVLFITHRLNTIRSADRILLMHQGSLPEDGSHQELLDMRGRYSTLFRQQEAAGDAA